jgi:predicted GNAT family acetyltransferase
MRCVVDPDLPTFAAAALPWLQRDPVTHNVSCTVTQTRLDGMLPLEPDALWLRLVDSAGDVDSTDGVDSTNGVDGDGDLVGTGIVTPPRGVLLSSMSKEAAVTIADHLAATRRELAGVDGPEEPAGVFAGRFTARTGLHAVEGLSARMYRLDTVTPPRGVAGRMREAVRCDRDLLVTWLDEFSAEALPHQPASRSGDLVDRRLEQGGFMWLWEDEGVPVSVLMVSRPAAGVVRIATVYTPPELRGHGYASGNVAAICQRALDTGASACMLYADRANPTSNRIYQRIGFRPAGDTQEWVFVSPGPAA